MKAYQKVNDLILAELEKGAIPWRKPWQIYLNPEGVAQHATNLVSGAEYQGTNFFILNLFNEWGSPYFLTYLQAKEKGSQVKKGESGLPVVWFGKVQKKDANGEKQFDSNGRPICFGCLKYSTVFNSEQCEDLEVPELAKAELLPHERFSRCESFVSYLLEASLIPAIEESRDLNCACYIPSKDIIQMPSLGYFEDPNRYYSTLFHEITHSTKKRLEAVDQLGARKGFEYAQEELVAELGASYLCAQFGIDNSHLLKQSASYIESWSRGIKDSKAFFVQASTHATRSSNFLLDSYRPEIKEAA